MHSPIARDHRALTLLVAGALWLGTAGVALAVPTTLNLIPTADTLAANEVTIQLEADGHSWPCDEGGEYWLLAGVGIADRLEIGLDRSMPQDGDGEWFMDAKVLLLPEGPSNPAVAIGALDLAHDAITSNWYVVGTKSVGDVRATIGYQGEEVDRFLLGASVDLCDRLTLLLDYSSGPGGALTLGAMAEVMPDLYGSLYYSWGNTAGADSFVGLNVAWYTSLW